MVSQTYVIFILLLTWCHKHISSSFLCCLHGIPRTIDAVIIFILLLQDVPNIHYLHSSFTGCPKHTLSSFFFYRMLKFNKSEGKLIISVKTFKIDIFHETERKQVLWNIVIIEHEAYAF